MLSQFISNDGVRLLGDLEFEFPVGTHAVGRLDADSEGLLILTTNKKITKLLFESGVPHLRTYLANVKNIVSAEKLKELQNGVVIRTGDKEFYTAVPIGAEIVDDLSVYGCLADTLPYAYPNTWLVITLAEGKYHQVRKMVAGLGHPCRRLIRVSIEDLFLNDLLPGEVREMTELDFFNNLKLQKM